MNVIVALAAVVAVLAAIPVAESAGPGVPAGRLERLSKGANITQWFQAYRPVDASHYRNYMSDDELKLIRSLGLRHVRLCFSPQFLYDPATPSKPLAENLAMFEEGIRRILAQDLAVVVDPHNTDRRRDGDPNWLQGYPIFWEALARRLSRFSSEMVILEVINEPVFDGRESEWFAIQEKIIAGMRKGAPQHTLMATGPNWGGIDGLKKMQPLTDKNIVYSFHCYDPFTFTHQGATWSGRVPPLLKGVPYPSSPEDVAEVAAKTEDSEARGWILDYGRKRWNRERLKERMAEALAWGKRHQVPLYCGEFGVYPRNAPPESRKAWFRDFASLLAESGVGYAVWGWDDGFGFGRRHENGRPLIDLVPVDALGLRKP
jgi:hypothetical protein